MISWLVSSITTFNYTWIVILDRLLSTIIDARELGNVLGDSDKVYFIPDGADITLFLGASTAPGGIVPVPVQVPDPAPVDSK